MSAAAFEQFSNRLARMFKHRAKWARRRSLECYRVYDRDIPAVPIAVDVYADAVVVQDFFYTFEEGEEHRNEKLQTALEIIEARLNVPAEKVFVKRRQRLKGGLARFESDRRENVERIVKEGDLAFIVNLSDYLDTGLFLDHRETRRLVREAAAGKRVLNLFAYTGAFSVYAAAGGAAQTTTVDLSRVYLDWAARNLELNSFSGPQHRLERADVREFLEAAPANAYDLIVMDAPTFSNSKRTERDFDVQRDYETLLLRALGCLAVGGTIYFSTNFRKFRFDDSGLGAVACEDISARTLPEDFRDARLRYCYQIVKM
jgi:23S rRNA G2069 N7-methylase RlmK/C1962 C5-methylase RlmI